MSVRQIAFRLELWLARAGIAKMLGPHVRHAALPPDARHLPGAARDGAPADRQHGDLHACDR